MVRKKDNTYENKIDGWLDEKKKKHMKKIDVQKNSRMVGWIEKKHINKLMDRKIDLKQMDGWVYSKNIWIKNGLLDGQ